MSSMSARDDRPSASIDPSLAGLVRLRAAQLQGCAHCLDLRTREARARGEREERLTLLDVWRAAPCYTAGERSALAFCEDVAAPDQGHVPPSVYRELRSHFGPDEVAALTRLIAEAKWDSVLAARSGPLAQKAALHPTTRA